MTNSSTAGGLTRRHMLAVLSVGTVATTAQAAPLRLGGRAAAQAPASPAAANLERGGFADWSALVGRRFRLAGAPGAPLKLIAVEPDVSDGPRPGAVRRRRGFAAIFETAAARAPEGDQAHWIAHGSGAALPVFLSPPAAVAGRTRLVAVFN
ncbi:MAG TPA: hypothetical protein VEW25_00585 [Allosphingosinicella sp.]|nr:hypothetical protein [Allosphingosinicella sp.]